MRLRIFPLFAIGLLTLDAAHAQHSPTRHSAPNRVLQLDGHGDYVRLPGGIFGDLSEITVEAWVRWDRFGYFSQWFAFGTDEHFRGMGLNHEMTWSTLQFFIYDRHHKLYLHQAPGDLPTATWHHMAAIAGRDGMRLYLDGVTMAVHPFSGP